MSNFELRDPWLLTVALLTPVVYHLFVRRRQSVVKYSTLADLDRLKPTWRVRLAHLPAVLVAGSVLFMAVALSGPRTGDDQSRVRREGIAIVMVVDRSGSMQARDMVRGDLRVDRLQVVKDIFKQFVLGSQAKGTWGDAQAGGRPDDAVGLVAFARYADGLCPLTIDHGNLVSILDDLEIASERSEDGTALGEGLALAVERLREHPARSKVAILLTDGVNNTGDISPQQAAELARVHGIKVYAIGVGTDGIAQVPVTNPLTGQMALRPVRVEIDQDTLKEIAQQTDGAYFRATDAPSLAQIYRQIDRLERTEITQLRYLEYRQWYPAFVWVALGMIGVGCGLAGTFLRRLP